MDYQQNALRELHLFAGAGGGILASLLLGHSIVAAVENDPYAAAVLCSRQNDGTFPSFPIWDDVCTFDGKPWRGIVDIVSGGFPCQDISSAGKGGGITGQRSGLWSEFARIVREIRPRFVFVENSPMLTVRGLEAVLGNLAAIGYDAEWCVLGADDVGAPHRRKRIWILAYTESYHTQRLSKRTQEKKSRLSISCQNVSNTDSKRCDGICDYRKGRHIPIDWQWDCEEIQQEREQWQPKPCSLYKVLPDTNSERQQKQRKHISVQQKNAAAGCGSWWSIEPSVGRVVDGLAYRAHMLRCIGNGQVPLVAATAFRLLAYRAGITL